MKNALLTAEWSLDHDGFCMLPHAVDLTTVQRLLSVLEGAFDEESQSVRARSSRGHVYAARNLINSIPDVLSVWQTGPMLALLRVTLGEGFGLVRALYFDKPPERTWNLPWHKDTSIAVIDNSVASLAFSRPTIKANDQGRGAACDCQRRYFATDAHLAHSS